MELQWIPHLPLRLKLSGTKLPSLAGRFDSCYIDTGSFFAKQGRWIVTRITFLHTAAAAITTAGVIYHFYWQCQLLAFSINALPLNWPHQEKS